MYRLNEIEIAYSRQREVPTDKVLSSQSAEAIFRKIWDADLDLRESFYILLLNHSNKVIGSSLISKGGLTGTMADVRMIFGTALKTLATGIILGHNHPSGAMKPSNPDKTLTRKLCEAGRIMDINILDHIILSPEDGMYFSFADEGLL